mmetsp:Transcript_31604/g.35367  ORF Transcript_31604/g.35367 Transcript_31604/m.35367 type:complete len:180 (-) Transcript_31604:297-836(-)
MLHHPNYGSNVTPPDDNNIDIVVVANTVVQKPIMTSSRTGTTSSATAMATATRRTGRRRLFLAGGAFIGTTCTITFGLFLKGYGYPMTSLLHLSTGCCAESDRDYCRLSSYHKNICQSIFAEDSVLDWGVEVCKGEVCFEEDADGCKPCYYDGGTNGPRCCTEKDHKTWYIFALHPRCH